MTISAPNKITIPFANSASSSYKRTVPVASQIGITNGAASFTDGFPPLTMTAIASGGVPPFGQDMNGILYAITQALQFQQAGGFYVYDSTFQTTVGGYPQGSLIMASDYSGLWLNTVENNTTAPESGGAGWVPYYQNGMTAVALTSSNVTLSPLEAAKNVLIFTGTITANIVVTIPAFVRNWIVYNNTTGAYTVTVKYASGAGVILKSGINLLFGDASNVFNTLVDYALLNSPAFIGTPTAPTPSIGDQSARLATTAYCDPAHLFNANGYQKLGSGFIIQGGYGYTDSSGQLAVTFPISFPSNCISVIPATSDPYYPSVINSTVTNSGVTLSATDYNGAYTSGVGVRYIAIGY